MRVSTDPTHPAYIDDRPRRAWVNDREIVGWVIADEFRRCVITPDGKVHNGAVLIERLPEEGQTITGDGSGTVLPQIDSGFVGVFEYVPDAKPLEVGKPLEGAVAVQRVRVKKHHR